MLGVQSTGDDVLAGMDLAGRRVLVTGVTAGLGLETARAALAHGAQVIGTARSMAKAQSACAGLHELAGARFTLEEMDLSSLASVRACAERLLERGEPLDAIIANAGIMACPFEPSADGFEMQFATNHLGHFVLANRLAPLLRAGGRLVSVSSRGHRLADIDLDDPNFARRPYNPLAAYGASKTANILFAVEFDRRHRARGVRAAAVHPGGVPTEISRDVPAEVFQELAAINQRLAEETGELPSPFKSIAQGAATSLWAAFAGDAAELGGRYCEDCRPLDPARDSGIRAYALDPRRARALWALSEALAGECFAEPQTA